MYGSVKKILVLSGLLLAANISYADDAAMDCVKTQWDGNNYIFKNLCDYNVFVMYCTEGKKTTGKFCGDYTGSEGLKGSFLCSLQWPCSGRSSTVVDFWA